MSSKISRFNERQLSDLVKYALLYPTRVRALVGAMLENLNIETNTEKLKQSLNPLTKIQLGLKENDLSTMQNWNIK